MLLFSFIWLNNSAVSISALNKHKESTILHIRASGSQRETITVTWLESAVWNPCYTHTHTQTTQGLPNDSNVFSYLGCTLSDRLREKYIVYYQTVLPIVSISVLICFVWGAAFNGQWVFQEAKSFLLSFINFNVGDIRFSLNQSASLWLCYWLYFLSPLYLRGQYWSRHDTSNACGCGWWCRTSPQLTSYHAFSGPS